MIIVTHTQQGQQFTRMDGSKEEYRQVTVTPSLHLTDESAFREIARLSSLCGGSCAESYEIHEMIPGGQIVRRSITGVRGVIVRDPA